MLLFGGAEFDGPGDTWIWDGAAWIQQTPTASPLARSFASMAYDAATGTVVLFGGFNESISASLLNDTWTWDGTTWTQQAPVHHPSAREGAPMAYDAATSTAVLFGGVGPHLFGDTWTWG